jgi:branched-chain amino acid transport system ATP-binding protein
MKAFRGRPSIYDQGDANARRADLEIRGVSLRFGGVMALGDIHLAVRTGELFAVIGPNGAGKTSLLNCITGFYRPQQGSILFNGLDITHLAPHELVRVGIGRTFQNIELFPGMTVLSNLFLARHTHCRYGLGPACLFLPSVRREEMRHRRILEEIIDFLEIQSVRNKPVGALPYGMMKEDMVRFLLQMNREWGQTMILVEHDMSIVMSIAGRIAVLNFGEKLTEGTPDEIIHHPEVIKAYLGDEDTV